MVALGMGLVACGRAAEPEADPRSSPRVVKTMRVRPESTSGRAFTGVVAPRVQSNLGFRVGGKIVARLVDIGQSVKAGQVLMRLDRTDLDHAVDAQEASVAAARALVTRADAEEARVRSLLASGAVPTNAYEAARAEADVRRALLLGAQAQSKVARDGARYAQLVADADGILVDVLAEPGQVVAAAQTVVRLAHAGAREALVSLPETLRPAVGSAAVASLYSSAGGEIPARLRQLSGAADPQTRTFEARYVLETDADRAPLGATVTVRIGEPGVVAGSDAFEVPLSAIRDGAPGKGTGVWLVDPKTQAVAFRAVQVRRFGEESAIVSGDVHDGEEIVALGAHLLHEGEHVVVAASPPGE
jgi:RND family efflux transporter MFP subunit